MQADIGKRVERQLKRQIFGLLAGATRSPPKRFSLEHVERVLVVRANFRLGNLLLMTPGLAALRGALPRARIDVLAHRSYVGLLSNSPNVDALIGVTRRTFRSVDLAHVLGDLRRQRYDLAIDAGRGSSFLGSMITGFCGARYRVATEDCRYKRFFNVFVTRARAHHKVDLLLGVLAGLDIPPVGRELRITLTGEEHEQAANTCRLMGIRPGISAVGINLGARGTKRWDTALLRKVVDGARRSHSGAVILLAGPEDRARLIEAYSLLPKGACVVAPLLPIRQFAALLAQLSVIVTGDTGPMHLAAAVGVPTVSLFTSPRSRCFRPLGPHHRTIYVVDDRDPVADILSAIDDLLAHPLAEAAFGTHSDPTAAESNA